MRTEAFMRVRSLEGSVRLTPSAPLARRAYLRELARSKVCFSPFGYGEVCWRDFEAVHAGTLLIKPDMGHIETAPDIFIAGETYLPVRWNFEDLPSVVANALSDEVLRRRIVGNAYEAMRVYAAGNRFVDQLERLFTP
jgi:hypothetical protein